MQVEFFDRKVKQFVEKLDVSVSAKVFRTFELLEQFGHALGMPHSKYVGGGMFELRIRGTTAIRIIYTWHKGMAVLLHGFVKKSQKIPQEEIEMVRQKLSTLAVI